MSAPSQTALKKRSNVDQVSEYITEKSGLKSSTSLGGLLGAKIANDNARVSALTEFIEKKQAFEAKQATLDTQEKPHDQAMMVNSRDDVAAVLGVIHEKELNEEAANRLIEDVKAIRTMETIKEQSAAHYSTPALEGLQEDINEYQLLDQMAMIAPNKQLNNIDELSMNYAYEAHRKTDVDAIEDQARQLDLSTADNAIHSLNNLDEQAELSVHVHQALATLGGQQKTVDKIFEEGLRADEPENDTDSANEVRHDTYKLYVADARGDTHLMKTDEKFDKVGSEENFGMDDTQLYNRTTHDQVQFLKNNQKAILSVRDPVSVLTRKNDGKLEKPR